MKIKGQFFETSKEALHPEKASQSELQVFQKGHQLLRVKGTKRYYDLRPLDSKGENFIRQADVKVSEKVPSLTQNSWINVHGIWKMADKSGTFLVTDAFGGFPWQDFLSHFSREEDLSFPERLVLVRDFLSCWQDPSFSEKVGGRSLFVSTFPFVQGGVLRFKNDLDTPEIKEYLKSSTYESFCDLWVSRSEKIIPAKDILGELLVIWQAFAQSSGFIFERDSKQQEKNIRKWLSSTNSLWEKFDSLISAEIYHEQIRSFLIQLFNREISLMDLYHKCQEWNDSLEKAQADEQEIEILLYAAQEEIKSHLISDSSRVYGIYHAHCGGMILYRLDQKGERGLCPQCKRSLIYPLEHDFITSASTLRQEIQEEIPAAILQDRKEELEDIPNFEEQDTLLDDYLEDDDSEDEVSDLEVPDLLPHTSPELIRLPLPVLDDSATATEEIPLKYAPSKMAPPPLEESFEGEVDLSEEEEEEGSLSTVEKISLDYSFLDVDLPDSEELNLKELEKKDSPSFPVRSQPILSQGKEETPWSNYYLVIFVFLGMIAFFLFSPKAKDPAYFFQQDDRASLLVLAQKISSSDDSLSQSLREQIPSELSLSLGKSEGQISSEDLNSLLVELNLLMERPQLIYSESLWGLFPSETQKLIRMSSWNKDDLGPVNRLLVEAYMELSTKVEKKLPKNEPEQEQRESFRLRIENARYTSYDISSGPAKVAVKISLETDKKDNLPEIAIYLQKKGEERVILKKDFQEVPQRGTIFQKVYNLDKVYLDCQVVVEFMDQRVTHDIEISEEFLMYIGEMKEFLKIRNLYYQLAQITKNLLEISESELEKQVQACEKTLESLALPKASYWGLPFASVRQSFENLLVQLAKPNLPQIKQSESWKNLKMIDVYLLEIERPLRKIIE